MINIRRRIAIVVLSYLAFAVAVIVIAPTLGSTSISLSKVFDRSLAWDSNVDAQIFFVARLPRVLAGALVGAALAAAGVILQALLRNPLATPFTLGVSAGGSLGAMLAVTLRWELSVLGITSIPLASFAGSSIATAIVYALAASQRRGLSTNVLLLAGVTLNAFFSALILFVQYLADFAEALRAIRWMMGGLDVAGYLPIAAALPLIAVAFAAFATMPRTLNLLSIGAEAAAAKGVEIVRAQRLAFFSASLATGAAVSLGGPIGFIGIIVPHLVRLMVGADHRVVLPASALFGASFLVACDLAARTLLSPLEIPVGVVTALIGGPFFLWLLVKRS
ncbi:MAG TPA: iron ABC transporter permease [Vicinamibacterales bacterium]|nr:iron ABC transporter permease [Vicinamibacterales bacterium]